VCLLLETFEGVIIGIFVALVVAMIGYLWRISDRLGDKLDQTFRDISSIASRTNEELGKLSERLANILTQFVSINETLRMYAPRSQSMPKPDPKLRMPQSHIIVTVDVETGETIASDKGTAFEFLFSEGIPPYAYKKAFSKLPIIRLDASTKFAVTSNLTLSLFRVVIDSKDPKECADVIKEFINIIDQEIVSKVVETDRFKAEFEKQF